MHLAANGTNLSFLGRFLVAVVSETYQGFLHRKGVER
jgi:hypothetical protein